MPPPASEVTGVHISELADPRPYLDGGELLLTTGIPFRGSEREIDAYVERLAAASLTGLVVGLGEGLDVVPPRLADRCASIGLPVLHVPDGAPFQHVTRAFWDLVAESGRADAMSSISTQTRLVRAADHPADAPARLVEILGQSLGGWAAYLPFGTADDVGSTVLWPSSLSALAPQLRPEVERLFVSSTFASATFQAAGRDVIGFPVSTADRTIGALVVGVARRPTTTDKQLVLTTQSLLGQLGRAGRGNGATSGPSEPRSLCARLLVDGHVEAARLVAAECGIRLAERVSVLAERTGSAPGSEAVPARVGAAPDDLVTTLDGVLYRLRDPRADGFGARSAAVPLSGVRDAARRLSALLAGPAARRGGALGLTRATEQLAVLDAYDRAPLVETTRAYLRSGRSWEESARTLGVHRNTVRHRIEIAERLLDASFADPDLAAELWLVLR